MSKPERRLRKTHSGALSLKSAFNGGAVKPEETRHLDPREQRSSGPMGWPEILSNDYDDVFSWNILDNVRQALKRLHTEERVAAKSAA
jgi:hypothetical protein